MTAEPVRLRSRPPLRRDLLAGLCVFGAYLLVAAIPESGRRGTADRNALSVLAFERWLHIDVEQALNTWLADHSTLMVVANYEYAYVYVISAFGLIFWLYFRHPDEYPPARDSFIALNLLAIACFAVFPLTPPRLLPELGYIDTLVAGTTFGSWGSPLIAQANQLAAMPSLHLAWALWVSVILARGRHAIALQLAAAAHVVVTVVVIAATATHFVADAVAAVPLVWLSVLLAERLRCPEGSVPVAAADAFFLHVETEAAPQQVGGMVVLAPSGPGTPTLDQIRTIVRDEFPKAARLCQRPEASSMWRRWRWIPVESAEMDWDWHVSERVAVPAPGSGVDDIDAASAVLSSVVAELAAAPLPRDRPMWRIVLVREISPGRCGLLFLVHHCVADGMGVIAHALRILRPRIELPAGGDPGPGAVRSALATVQGLAQLATDGKAHAKLGGGSPARQFATTVLDLDAVRSLAHDHRATVTDVLLTLVATAVGQTHPAFAEVLGQRLRVGVTVLLQEPGSTASGNVTGAVMIDLPLDGRDPIARLADIRQRSMRLRTPSRALASRFVMAHLLELLPPPLQRWFARSVYGAPFLQAIVSNMAGPPMPMSVCDITLARVVPILPLAPGAPLAVGALSWTGGLGIGVAVDSGLLDADRLTAGIGQAAEALSVPETPAGYREPPPSH